MRTRDPDVSAATLDEAIEEYQQYSTHLARHGVHLRWWIARYSRGDALEELREAFAVLAQKVATSAQAAREQYGPDHVLFGYQPTDAGMFRDALVLLSIALCVRAPHEQVASIVDACQRGDALIEALIRAAYPERAVSVTTRAFPQEFDGLYAVLDAPGPQRAHVVGDYLKAWPERTREFGFRISQQKLGYWCFEAAGIVAAFKIDDASFAGDSHYPRDLVKFRSRAS